jgi:hypothetical protein
MSESGEEIHQIDEFIPNISHPQIKQKKRNLQVLPKKPRGPFQYKPMNQRVENQVTPDELSSSAR